MLRVWEADPQMELWIGALQRAEVLFHVLPGEERLTGFVLRRFRTAPVTEEVVDLGARLFSRWNRSHGVDENDALLAATAVLTGGQVITMNLKHFPMPEVRATLGWTRPARQ